MFSFLNRNLEQNLYPLVIRKYVRTVQQRTERKKCLLKFYLTHFYRTRTRLFQQKFMFDFLFQIVTYMYVPNPHLEERLEYHIKFLFPWK